MELPKDVATNRRAILDSSTYLLAEVDIEFLGRAEQRPVRMQLELQKVEFFLRENKIKSTVVCFGGTQIVPRAEAEARLATAKHLLKQHPNDERLARNVFRAESVLKKSHFYDDGLEFGKLVSTKCRDLDGEFVIATGGGPGIMEAVNRGAYEVGAKNVGFNIELPHEQEPNPYITPELCFQFSYFALRKFHFVLRAAALVVFPGGYGTLDELFDTLTLRQTGRMQEIPIILFGRDYWTRVINFQTMADEGVIADEHLDLVHFAETPAEAWQIIAEFHHLEP